MTNIVTQQLPNQADTLSSSENDPIVLVCAADDNYAMPLAVTLRSALENLGSDRRIALFIIDGGIKDKNKQKIVDSISSDNTDVSWLKPYDNIINELNSPYYYTKTVYYRLFMAELLPNYKKAIYLDADLLVIEDLGKLWDIDITSNYVSAIQDLYPVKDDYLLAEKELSYTLPKLQEFNFLPSVPNEHFASSPYKSFFNAGVLIINLEKWRTEKIGGKIINFLNRNKRYKLNDQDGLNLFFRDNWGKLDLRWNQTAIVHDSFFENTPFPSLLPKEEMENLENRPYIIHFTSADKPWNSISRHPAQPLFYQYLDMTAWSGWRFTQWKRIQRRLNREANRIWQKISPIE